jgi:hypothetical protein
MDSLQESHTVLNLAVPHYQVSFYGENVLPVLVAQIYLLKECVRSQYLLVFKRRR